MMLANLAYLEKWQRRFSLATVRGHRTYWGSYMMMYEDPWVPKLKEVTLTNSFNRFDLGYLLKHKLESFEIEISKWSRKLLDKKIKVFRSDREDEYLSQEFVDHLRSREMVSRLTPSETPWGWCFWEEESNSIWYGSIYDESNWSSVILLRICFRSCRVHT